MFSHKINVLPDLDLLLMMLWAADSFDLFIHSVLTLPCVSATVRAKSDAETSNQTIRFGEKNKNLIKKKDSAFTPRGRYRSASQREQKKTLLLAS